MKKNESVILPGSYDPVTLGHLEIIKKASELYTEVYAVIFINPEKTYKFSLEERVKMLILATEDLENVLVSYSLGYVVDYMREHNIDKIIKGYRNEKDLEYELKQAAFNKERGGYDTELWLSDDGMRDISSTKARNAIDSCTDLSKLLPKTVIDYLEKSGFDR